MMGIFSLESNSPKGQRTPSQKDLMDESSRCLEKSEKARDTLGLRGNARNYIKLKCQVISNSNSPIEFCLHLTMSFTVSPFWKVYGLESAIVQVS